MTTTTLSPEDLDPQREALVREVDRLTGELHSTRQRLHTLNRQEQRRDYEIALSSAGRKATACRGN